MSVAGRLGSAHFRAAILAASCCAFAFLCGWLEIRDLEWPGMEDFGRDMATAQYLLDTGRLADPFYDGEALWYPPVAPLATAAVARIFGLEVPEAAVRAGPWLNLLSAFAFYLLAARVLGPVAGVAALACFLFLSGGSRQWFVIATWSPWLVPFNLAQGFFYLGVLALLRARTSPGVRWHVATGLLGGITFLTHVTPALLLGALTLFVAAWSWRDARRAGVPHPFRSGASRFALTGAVAALVAAPFLVPLWTRYRFTVVNRAPGSFVAPADVGSILAAELSPDGVIAAAGVVALVLLARRRPDVVLLLAWPAACTLAVVWHHTRLALAPQSPDVVPVHHWYIYLSAFRSLAFGAGMAFLLAPLARGAGPSPAPGRTRLARYAFPAIACMLAGSALVPALAAYPANVDLGRFREKALEFQAHDATPIARWMRANLPVGAIVLASPDVATLWVGPAGKKTVLADKVLSSPFVDWDARNADYHELFRSVVAGDRDGFLALADKYGFSHVLTGKSPPFTWMTPAFRHGKLVLNTVEWPWTPAGAARAWIHEPPAGATLRARDAPRVVLSVPEDSTRVAVTFDVEVGEKWFALRYDVDLAGLPRNGAGRRTFVPGAAAPPDAPIPGLGWGKMHETVSLILADVGRPALRGRVRVEAFRNGRPEPVAVSLPRAFLLAP